MTTASRRIQAPRYARVAAVSLVLAAALIGAGPLAQASIKLEEQHTSPRPKVDKNHAHQDILDSMGYDPVSVDSLAQRTGMKINQLSSVLLILEMEGKITPQAGGHYIRNGQT